MISAGICVLAFAAAYWAGRRALWLGITVVLVVGYLYGIARAHLSDAFIHLLFDASVAGLYAACLWAAATARNRAGLYELKLWVILLLAWPTFLFFTTPGDVLIQMVGWRANAFVLPCLLLGAQLDDEQLYWLGLGIAVLNIGAAIVGALEFTFGLQMFFPRNEITDILYQSRLSDQQWWLGLRIPSTFVNAHAYGGTMVMTLPFIFGAWLHQRTRAHGHLLTAAVIASLLGVFMAGARTPMIALAGLIVLVSLSRSVRGGARLTWVGVMMVVAFVVAGDNRLQRFASLQDSTYIAQRLGGSINSEFFELMWGHPFGRGLAGGGTSIPYFLQDRSTAYFVMENEFARIALEQGIPGFFMWVCFMLWVLVQGQRKASDSWQLSRRLMLAATFAYFLFALTGIGLLTSVPLSMVLLIGIGWISVRDKSTAHAFMPNRTKRELAQTA
jgi:hypothetical protein